MDNNFFGSAQGTFFFLYLEAVKVDKFLEGQRKYFDLHASPGQISGIFRGQEICIGACDINITVEVHTEGVHRIFPMVDPLKFIEEQIHPFSGKNT